MTVQTTTPTLTATESAILGLLARRGSLSGYDLKKAIEGSVGYFWGPAKSQIYAVLPRLVDDGYATRRKVVQAERPDKAVYRITKQGRQALKSWIEETPMPPEPSRNPLLLKLFFGDISSPEVLLEQVRERRQAVERLKAELEEIESVPRDPESDFYPALTRRYGLRYAQAMIRWSEETERELERVSRKRGA
jgi:PadR family transcriptional regulator, regulatory protein AphA